MATRLPFVPRFGHGASGFHHSLFATMRFESPAADRSAH
jgi:hypothetical protein